MRDRIRVVAVVTVVLAVGALLGSALSQWTTALPTATRAENPSDSLIAPTERVRVQVLNGGGVAGMARSATDRLRDVGFDVVDFGNASMFDRDSSVVLDRVGNSEWATAVARVLDIPHIRSEPDADLLVDVTVVLGSTWSLEALVTEPVRVRQRPWWDLRQLFDRTRRPDPVRGVPGGRLADPAEQGI